MASALLPYEAVAIAGICKALRGSNLQVRQPSYIEPAFWSRPLFKTAYTAIPPNTDWTDLVVVQGLKQYVALIKQYVATSYGDIAISGLLFRMLMNGVPITSVNLAPGVEFNKDGPMVYPIIPREIFIPVNETERFSLQVKNPTGAQSIAIGMLSGWFMEAVDSTVTSDTNAMVDGVSTAMLGRDYGA
jgi:hypothetical protein